VVGRLLGPAVQRGPVRRAAKALIATR
jgi:hypothetical protein